VKQNDPKATETVKRSHNSYTQTNSR